jgi:TonB family protein
VDVNLVAPSTILDQLADRIACTLDVDKNLPQEDISLRLSNVRARTALDAVCDMVGCRWSLKGTTLVVTATAPPPAVPQVPQWLAKAKTPLLGDSWNLVRVPLHEVADALSKAVGATFVFEGADPQTPITANLVGQSPFRAVYRIMEALGWGSRGAEWSSGRIEFDGPAVIRMRGRPKVDANPLPQTPVEKIYEKDEPGLTMPKVMSAARPSYTRAAMDARIEGKVIASAVVERDGMVGDVKLLTTLHPDLDQEAIRAAKEWRFVPGMKDGKPVPVRITLELTFTLR